MSFLGALRKTIVFLAIFLGAFFVLPGLPPSITFPFKEYVIKPARELKGTLEPNYHLNGARQLWKNQVFGPECLLAYNDEIITGIHGGEVLRLNKAETIQPFTKIGKPCDFIFDDALCGYPVGLGLDTQGNNLIIADSYYGLWEVSLDTKKKTILVSPDQILPGKKVNRRARLFNALVISRQGDIYWTDSMSDDMVLAPFANPSDFLDSTARRRQTRYC
ncbi:adipocyte plasma membrane-associated protein isoform X2 [Drosophila ficusphila]|uniref:adipocyte plasma membrane-associated protein isoform X2 n=1 Tax=Drosophila ficusphila TaxID=30025 RepID=UPI0007E5FDB0|nr:adipocyte plasma membrane-associated protein isoform X2 [Drosophila ficusphila]